MQSRVARVDIPGSLTAPCSQCSYVKSVGPVTAEHSVLNIVSHIATAGASISILDHKSSNIHIILLLSLYNQNCRENFGYPVYLK